MAIFRRPFLKQFALCYRSVVCLSCLSVCNVGVLLWPNGWTDQYETWHVGRLRSWPHCVRWGPSSPSPKGHSPPIFGPYLLRPNGCMDQDVTWYGARSRPRRLCVRWGFCCPSQRGQTLIFSSHVYCDQTAGWMKLILGMVVGLSPGKFVLDVEPAPPPKGAEPLPNFKG